MRILKRIKHNGINDGEPVTKIYWWKRILFSRIEAVRVLLLFIEEIESAIRQPEGCQQEG